MSYVLPNRFISGSSIVCCAVDVDYLDCFACTQSYVVMFYVNIGNYAAQMKCGDYRYIKVLL